MLWFFHVPHTGGRALGRYLWSNHSGKYKKLHNSEDILATVTAAVESGVEKTERIIKYFILRDPIERGYKEFLHYSNNLTQIGQVNHLNLENLKQTNPNFDHTDPVAYFSLEVNRNVYCKFLLERTDFSQPVTDRDLCLLLNKFSQSSTNHDKRNQEFYYDLFTDLQNGSMPVLEKILGATITLPTPRQFHNKQPNEEHAAKVPDDIRKIIEERNIYDVQLFSSLCQT